MDRLRHAASPGAAAFGQESGGRAAASLEAPSLQLSRALAADAGGSSCEVAALLEWVQMVAGRYDASVDNFGDAFADGSVLCLLVREGLLVRHLSCLRCRGSPRWYCPSGASSPGVDCTTPPMDTASLLQIHHYQGEDHMPLRAVFRRAPGTPLADCRHGAARNFAAVLAAADALGSVPRILSGEEFFQEQGADERSVVLFCALLCRRLVEAHREERAAMVIQRHFRRLHLHRPGTAREHLHRWVSAAGVVQRCTRAWLARTAVQRAAKQRRREVAAATALQAAWRGRPYRLRYLQLRAGVVKIQAAWKGKLARRAHFDSTLAPAVAAAALQRRRQLLQHTQQARALRVQAAEECAGRQPDASGRDAEAD
jgi:hypothetical protein